MHEEANPSTTHALRLCTWALFVAAFAFLYYRASSQWITGLTEAATSSAWLAYALYLALGAVRGFALIPVTSVVLLAIPLFPPVPLFVLTMIGIVISSASIYAFAGSMRLAEYFERNYAKQTERVRAALQQYPTAIVAGWSFLLVMPTDLICYVCGSMKISFRRFMLGVLIGEGAIVGVYIFAGSTLLELGKRVFGADVAEAQVAARPLEVPEGGQPDGAAVYAEHCALCHEQVDERIPHRSALNVSGPYRPRARRRRHAGDRDVDGSRRAARGGRLSRHRRERRGPAGRCVLHRSHGDARRNPRGVERVEPAARQRAVSNSRACGLHGRTSTEPQIEMGVRLRGRRQRVCGADDRRRPCFRR
jgi:uncharacterized membrane protein YdjX (TVP38/TMEM64 family)